MKRGFSLSILTGRDGEELQPPATALSPMESDEEGLQPPATALSTVGRA